MSIEPNHGCEYCHSSSSLFAGQVYCSLHGPKMEALESGMFFLKKKQLETAQHVSRLSIRWNANGIQNYRLGGNDEYQIDPGRYLLINEGQSYETRMDSDTELSMVGVAFEPGLASKMYRSLTEAVELLLDDPFRENEKLLFFERTSSIPADLARLFSGINGKQGRIGRDELDMDSIFARSLEVILEDQMDVYRRVEALPSVKSSTRRELFKRVSIGREFIEGNLGTGLDLESIAQESCLSRFHFLRLFKNAFGVTPHQYITGRRIERACFYLASTDLPVNEICLKVGFEDPSSFGRLFKRRIGLSPLKYRQSQSAAA